MNQQMQTHRTESFILPRQNQELAASFRGNAQDLSIVARRITSHEVIDVEDLARFDFELRNYHTKDIVDIVKHFRTSLVNGLTKELASERFLKNGPNAVKPAKQIPLWMKFLLCFVTGFSPLLWIASGLAFISWEPFGTPPTNLYNLVLAIVLIIVIVLTAIFSFYQEMKANNIIKGFQNLVPSKCLVTRQGVAIEIQATELVVGDLVTLISGQRVPSDIRVVSSNGLKVDKSMLTGESQPMKVKIASHDDSVTYLEATNIVFMGCTIIEGDGTGIVIATGSDNQLSKIIEQTTQKEKKTSLQQEIDRLVLIIGSLASITTIVVILYWIFYLRVTHGTFMNLSSMISNVIGVTISFVPEGLPLAMTIGLTYIARRLCLKHFVLVKRLGIIETLGSISFLASDKTGTLTQNKMTVMGLITDCTSSNIRRISSNKYHKAAGDDDDDDDHTEFICHIHIMEVTEKISVLCNQAEIDTSNTPGNTVDPVGKDMEADMSKVNAIAIGSNATDRAVLQWCMNTQCIDTIRQQYEVMTLLPFSSATKLTAVVVKKLDTKQFYVLIKGAPEYIINLCTSYLSADAVVEMMTPEFSTRIYEHIDTNADMGRRVIALAELGPLNTIDYPESYLFNIDPRPNFPMTNFTFISCIAVADPPRIGVREAVQELRTAGIRVSMVTGDAPNTAVAISRAVGIISHQNIIDKMESFNRFSESGDIDYSLAFGSAKQNVSPNSMNHTSNELTSIHPTNNYTHNQDVTISNRISIDRQSNINAMTPTMSPSIVVTGKDLETISPSGWDYIFEHNELVFARTTPEQKLMIVRESQRRGYRVGVTGDGVNDSPALKKADIGIAMNSGSDVAKDVASMILLHDDFTSIPKGVQEGRLIFENLRKVIAYQISAGCYSELLPVLATFFLGIPQPLSSFLMIMISCFSDVFAGCALMAEPPERMIMTLPPRNAKTQRLMDFKLIGYAYFFYANLESTGAFVNYFLYMASRGDTRSVPTPVPADDDGTRTFPAGYRTSQLLFAWNWGANSGELGKDAISASNEGSSVFYITLICAQMGHLLSIRRKSPYFYDAIMNTNAELSHYSLLYRIYLEIRSSEIRWPILAAWCGAIIVANIVNNVEFFNIYCGTHPVPPVFWGMAFGWSALWFTIGEIRKWMIIFFPNSIIAKWAW